MLSRLIAQYCADLHTIAPYCALLRLIASQLPPFRVCHPSHQDIRMLLRPNAHHIASYCAPYCAHLHAVHSAQNAKPSESLPPTRAGSGPVLRSPLHLVAAVAACTALRRGPNPSPRRARMAGLGLTRDSATAVVPCCALLRLVALCCTMLRPVGSGACSYRRDPQNEAQQGATRRNKQVPRAMKKKRRNKAQHGATMRNKAQ